jgi:hypothetical protein
MPLQHIATLHADHHTFITALEAYELVSLTFASTDDGGAHLLRSCAPLDYGPRSHAPDLSDHYHLWDYDSDSPGDPHVLCLPPAQIVSIATLGDTFHPAEFITWDCDWHHPRDWGPFS